MLPWLVGDDLASGRVKREPLQCKLDRVCHQRIFWPVLFAVPRVGQAHRRLPKLARSMKILLRIRASGRRREYRWSHVAITIEMQTRTFLTKRQSARNGAANRTRTCDPVITNDVLYQLSYCGGPDAHARPK